MHYAEVRVRGKQIEEMHRKDIRNSEELKKSKAEATSVSEGMDQTLKAKMKDENSETIKHDTEFHEFRTAVAAGADLQHARMTNEVTRISP